MPCSEDMIGRRRRRSTATPCAFIATSSVAYTAPNSSSTPPSAEQARAPARGRAGRARSSHTASAVTGRLPIAMRGRAGERHRDQRADRRHQQRDPELPLAQAQPGLDLGDPRHPAAIAEAVQEEDRGDPGPRLEQARRLSGSEASTGR